MPESLYCYYLNRVNTTYLYIAINQYYITNARIIKQILLVNIQIRLRSFPWPSDTIFAIDLPKCFNNRNRYENRNRNRYRKRNINPNALQNIHKFRENSLSISISFFTSPLYVLAASFSPVQLLCTSIMPFRWFIFSFFFFLCF